MWRKINENLALIKSEVHKIREYVEPKTKIENGIEIKTFFPSQSIQPTKISFQMAYHDWLKLEKSKEWKEFHKLLLKSQSKGNLKHQKDNLD